MSDEPTADGQAILEASPAGSALLDAARRAGLALDGVWLVGGAVRDALLERTPGPDVDLAVEGSGAAFAHLLASATGGEVVAKHSFGTATVLAPIATLPAPLRVDVATCRDEVYSDPGALPTVRLGAAIDADLARRDVAANAVAVALAPGPDGGHVVKDPHGGRADIAARRLRVLHDSSFLDDPTRIFRVARYAGRLGFLVENATRELAIAAVEAGALATVSADRVRVELELVLRERASESLSLLASWGVLKCLDPRLHQALCSPPLLPAIDAACGDDVDLHRRAWTLRLAVLARPLGPDAAGWLRWLGFPSSTVSEVAEMTSVLDAVLARGPALRELANSDLYLELGEVSDDAFALAALAANDDPALLECLARFHTSLRATQLTVRGDDVVAAGVPAGPAVGRILGDIFLLALDGALCGGDEERRAVTQLAARYDALERAKE